jgi:2',3'-cyclic-nucleotide 2'-phosphodiesterase (5'-nucleotidase family)
MLRAPLLLFAPVLLAGALLAPSAARAVPISIVGTSDLHGRIERTAVLAGYLKVLRANAKKAGGGVIFVDAGDMFQGTLESNLVEGKSVIDAYNLLKPDAVAIGNHEFDFGPVGPAATPRRPEDDPRGALKARIKEARFPFLAANVIDEKTGKPVAWPNTRPSHVVTIAGVKVGIIGVTTKDTAYTTTPANFVGLKVMPLKEAVAREADALRGKGAAVIVVVAHAGGKCTNLDNPFDTASCELDAEIFQLAGSLPEGLVNVIVAAHTHQQIAHVASGVPIIQAWANGKGFGRVDLDVDPKTKKVELVKVHPPQRLCADDEAPVCATGSYEGAPVVVDATVAKAVAPYVRDATRLRDKKLGVHVTREVRRGYDTESALGNLFTDLMLEAAPGADVTLMNGGGIRANLPPGDLTYGHIFEMMPFDNRFARVAASGAVLRAWLESSFSARKGGILSIGGVRADVTCAGKKAKVVLKRPDGRVIADDEQLTILTSDFLASGGEATKLPPGSVTMDDGDNIRESLVKALERRGGTLDGEDRALFDPARRRIAPGRCKAEQAE